ncbi:putative protein phosphatase 2C 24 [Nymphaea thermarum]|nr:putative protein phosphatase 2C 24 [Nymphaea thermarum]
MAEICCEVASDGEAAPECVPSSVAARRRRLEVRSFKLIADVTASAAERARKRQKAVAPVVLLQCGDTIETCSKPLLIEKKGDDAFSGEERQDPVLLPGEERKDPLEVPARPSVVKDRCPRFGTSSLCGRRREMEDALSTVPAFFRRPAWNSGAGFHFFGVFDGHGCSHVALSCKDRMHHLVAEELGSAPGPALAENQNGRKFPEWKEALERSFLRMDKEVSGEVATDRACKCEAGTPHHAAVGSTAVVAVVSPNEIAVANCGDSRAVLCRNGTAVPLSSDHKPDRPDELLRIQAAGGRVIYWDCPRVLGVLAMSRSIGDDYLKPYVSSTPEITVTERARGDECLILASDGLWDVMTNEEACSIASRCLQGAGGDGDGESSASGEGDPDPACTIAATLLTKMALIRQSSDNVSVVVVDLRRNVL